MTHFKQFFSYALFTAFILCLCIHLSTYLGLMAWQSEAIMSLFIGLIAIAVVILMLYLTREQQPIAISSFNPIAQFYVQHQGTIFRLLNFYITINFFLFLYFQFDHTVDMIQPDEYVFMDRATATGPATLADYELYQMHLKRWWSGHLLWFYFVAYMMYHMILQKSREVKTEQEI